MPPLNPNSAERRLYYGVLILIIFLMALWSFWPQKRSHNEDAKFVQPTLILSDELKAFFISAQVKQTEKNFYLIQLTLEPEYHKRLAGNSNTLFIRYELRSTHHAMSGGTASVTLSPAEPATVLRVDNPNRLFPQNILLSLAR